MKLSVKLAVMNIRRYPLRILGSAVCLLVFGFSVFSALLFTSSLSANVSKVLKSRSSGNTIFVETDIDELESIAENPDILEACPCYWADFVSGYIEIEGIGEFDINLFYEQAPDIEALIPDTYFEEFRIISGGEFLVAGRMPENPNEIIINQRWFDNQNFNDYNPVLNKKISLYSDYIYDERITHLENAEIVGIFTDEFLEINALNNCLDWTDVGFLINSESKYQGIEMFCSIDKIDSVYKELCASYVGERVFEPIIITSPAIEKLSGLNSFIGNLMYLASGAIAFIYVMIRLISTSNYLKEKSRFITAADAFGCGKTHILGAFAAENIALLIPISCISALLGCSFIKMIFRIISAYVGVELDVTINFVMVFLAFALMVLFEFLILLISLFIFRKKSND